MLWSLCYKIASTLCPKSLRTGTDESIEVVLQIHVPWRPTCNAQTPHRGIPISRPAMAGFTKIIIQYLLAADKSIKQQPIRTYLKSDIILLLSGSMSQIAIGLLCLQRGGVFGSRRFIFLRSEPLIQSCRRFDAL